MPRNEVLRSWHKHTTFVAPWIWGSVVNMIEVTVRKQGGAAIMTIPSDVLKMLNIDVGGRLALDVAKGLLTLRPVRSKTGRKRKHYTLNDLLKGVTKEGMKALYDESSWAREGAPMGRELA